MKLSDTSTVRIEISGGVRCLYNGVQVFLFSSFFQGVGTYKKEKTMNQERMEKKKIRQYMYVFECDVLNNEARSGGTDDDPEQQEVYKEVRKREQAGWRDEDD